jgi:hypothetical protein
MRRVLENATLPGWAEAWGPELLACEEGWPGDAFCAARLPAGAAGRAGLCAHLSGGIASEHGVADGWWCACSLFHSGPNCTDVSPGAYAIVAGHSLLALYLCKVFARLWRALTVMRRNSHHPSTRPALLSARLLLFACVCTWGMLYVQASQALPSGVFLNMGAAIRNGPILGSIIFAIQVSAVVSVAATAFESSSSGRLAGRRYLLGLSTVLLFWVLVVAIALAGWPHASAVCVYLLASVAFGFFVHAESVLRAKIELCTAQLSNGQVLRRLTAASRRLRDVKRHIQVVFLFFAIFVALDSLGLSQLSAPISQLPSFAFRSVLVWLRYCVAFRTYLSMANFLDGPFTDSDIEGSFRSEPSKKPCELRATSGEQKVAPARA